ncbi:MAG: alpha/beta hydrolase [Pseudomonadota bacterium]
MSVTVEDLFVDTADAVRLHVRRYRGGDKTAAFCIPGLTRNAADFETVAPLVAATGRDVYAISLRGRGRSGWAKDVNTYHPVQYRDDVSAVMDKLDLRRAIFIGTSLGGIVTMLMKDAEPQRVAAAIINDVGPTLAEAGLARIAGYVGEAKPPATSVDEAAQRIRAINDVAFPDRDDAFWRAFARRTFREEQGRWRLDYDPAIATAFASAPPAPDLWPPFRALADTPTLLVHGLLSDLLTRDIVDEMTAANPDLHYCGVAGVGHAPMLDEPEATVAIERFVSAID